MKIFIKKITKIKKLVDKKLILKKFLIKNYKIFILIINKNK